MATDLENLISTRTAILVELASITTDSPDYSKDGQTVSRRRNGLLIDLAQVNALLGATQGPFEELGQGVT